MKGTQTPERIWRFGPGHLARRSRRLRAVRTRKTFLLGMGGSLLVAGAILAPTPIPIGLAMVAVGLYLLARVSRRTVDVVVALRRFCPPLSRSLSSVRNRGTPGVRRFIDRTDPALRKPKATPEPPGAV